MTISPEAMGAEAGPSSLKPPGTISYAASPVATLSRPMMITPFSPMQYMLIKTIGSPLGKMTSLFHSRPLDTVHEDLASRMDPVGEFAGEDVKVVAGLGREDPAEVVPGVALASLGELDGM